MSEGRPEVAIGHVSLRVGDVARSARFYETLGTRPVMVEDRMAILELRGGTHLMLFAAKRTPRRGRIRSFDLMVDDVDATRERLTQAEIECGPLQDDRMSQHRWFEVTDPDGHVLGVYSSHAGSRPV